MHSLHRHWRLQYTLHTVTGDYNTLFTPSLETAIHSLHCHWRLQYALYTVTGDCHTLFTLSLETAIRCLHCHWRLQYTLYTVTGIRILLPCHAVFLSYGKSQLVGTLSPVNRQGLYQGYIRQKRSKRLPLVSTSLLYPLPLVHQNSYFLFCF